MCLCQTLVLMSDLATVLDLQGKHDEALAQVKKAVELGQTAGYPDQHVLLGNMAGILMHKGKRRVLLLNLLHNKRIVTTSRK